MEYFLIATHGSFFWFMTGGIDWQAISDNCSGNASVLCRERFSFSDYNSLLLSCCLAGTLGLQTLGVQTTHTTFSFVLHFARLSGCDAEHASVFPRVFSFLGVVGFDKPVAVVS